MVEEEEKAEQSLFKRKVLWVAVIATGGLVLDIILEKYSDFVPDVVVVVLILIFTCSWFYLFWTSKTVKQYRHLIYNYPIMSMILIMVIGAVFGGLGGLLIWIGVYRQPQLPSDQTTQAQIKPEDPPSLISTNVELKKDAKQLSAEILQFISEINSREPKSSSLDVPLIIRNKNGSIAKRSLPEYNKFKEERDRRNQITEIYYQEMKDEFRKRYAVRYQIILNDLAKQGAELKNSDTVMRAQTNAISMQMSAMRLAELAEQLPDTK